MGEMAVFLVNPYQNNQICLCLANNFFFLFSKMKLQLPRYTNDHKLGEWIQSWEQGVSFLVSRVIETNIEHDLISMFDTINRWRIKAASEVTSQKVFYCSQNWIRQIKHALYCLVSRGDLRFIGRGLTGTPWWGGHEV